MVIGKFTDALRRIFLVWGGLEEMGDVEELFMEKFVTGEENFHEGARDFLAIF